MLPKDEIFIYVELNNDQRKKIDGIWHIHGQKIKMLLVQNKHPYTIVANFKKSKPKGLIHTRRENKQRQVMVTEGSNTDWRQILFDEDPQKFFVNYGCYSLPNNFVDKQM